MTEKSWFKFKNVKSCNNQFVNPASVFSVSFGNEVCYSKLDVIIESKHVNEDALIHSH